MESLTARVLQFQRTGRGGEEVVGEVARRIYEYPRRKCRWDEEASSEFFSRVFPKVRDMIARFRNVGRPFESYLASMLLYQVRTFVQRRHRRDLEWEIAADPDLWGIDRAAREVTAREAPESDDSADADGPWGSVGVCADRERPGAADGSDFLSSPVARRLFDVGADGAIGSPCSRRRFLVAVLKAAHLLTDADVAGVARLTGVDEEALHATVQTLRARCHARMRRLELFTQRRNRAFSGLRLTQTRLAREIDPERRRELELRDLRLRKSLRACQRVIERIRLGPSHRQIAEALGMPKPSVDSTMHRLKLRAAALYPPDHEKYA